VSSPALAGALPPVDQAGHHGDRNQSDGHHRELHQIVHVLLIGSAARNLRVLGGLEHCGA
jgi:hypothetical protein